MCEIDRTNFKAKLPEIKRSLEKAKFIAIDCEFSALNAIQQPRLFDDNKTRYAKIRVNLSHIAPLQVGITAFSYDSLSNDYFGEVWTFYVAPVSMAGLDKAFYFQASTLEFLSLHNFDFNKFVYVGVPYLNKDEEARLRSNLKTEDYSGENSHLAQDFSNIIKTIVPIVSKWYSECKAGDVLEIPEFRKYSPVIVYFLHKHLRMRFQHLWTMETTGFYVKKVTAEKYAALVKTCTLDEDIVQDLIGFRHVFNMLTDLKRPIVGHNLMQDLILMIHNFETILPESYTQFKRLAVSLFPGIYDTKCISYGLRPSIPKERLPDNTNLQVLYNYYKDGLGRHLALNCSAIQSNITLRDLDTYHQAGWDSYCTGYIFIRMGYFNLAKDSPKSKSFVCSELINGLYKYKNCVNVIRGAADYMCLDGEDPSSQRPPWLIIEERRQEPIDIRNLMSILSGCGFVDIKRLGRNDRVLVAVDTFRAAKEIAKTFSANPKFHVKPYNFFRHSPVARNAYFIGALTISGTLLVWITSAFIKR